VIRAARQCLLAETRLKPGGKGDLSMSLQFRALLDMVDTAVNQSALSQAIRFFALDHGFQHHAYLSLEGSAVRYLGDYPEAWEQIYLRESLSTVDPVVARARQENGVFSWSASDWLRSSAGKLKDFAGHAIDHGIGHGLSISTRASFDRQLILTLARHDGAFRPLSDGNLQDALSVVLAMHYRLKELGEPARSHQGAPLSSRELLCLTWAAKGKGTPEISILTGLSSRTVQHYLDAARLKLGAATVAQLVAISKDIRLI
jgi:LuxR family transcriptional activator of conjugal transfer of Ti plasmids